MKNKRRPEKALSILARKTAVIWMTLLFPCAVISQYTIVDDQFYSDALQADELVDVWLPPGYDEDPDTYYPVVYLLHKAFSNQDSYGEFLPVLDQMVADGEIDPFIIIKPNGWAPPYLGSCWYNSALYGNYEDMVRIDLINYIESNYRVLTGQDYRYHLGHSMGGHAGWSMSIRFPQLFAAVADIAGYKNMGMTTQLLLPSFLAESGGAPPYSYSPGNGQLSALVYTVLGAYNANMDNPPFYVNMFLDENGDIIPEYYDDWLSDDIMLMVPGAAHPPNTKYWIAQGLYDNVVPYPTITKFREMLNENCWDYEYFEYAAGHFDFMEPMEEAFRFIDEVWKTKSPVPVTDLDYSFMVEDIEFQPGVTIDINVNVYVNEGANNWPDHGKVIAVEGMAHTANCWKPFAESLFENGPHAAQLNEFFAIDMPGRGGSGLPEAEGQVFPLDHMYIEDYLAVIKGVIEYLNDEMGVHPTTLMGHSLGGLEVILLQDRLIAEGSNLRQEFGIKNALLLAPGIPDPLDWAFIEPGGPSGNLLAYVPIPPEDPSLGLVLDIPCSVWPYLFFTNRTELYQYNMVPGAPTTTEARVNGYSAIEPAPLLLQVSGGQFPPPLNQIYPYKPRVHAERGIFKPRYGVQLTILADQYDKMMLPDEEEALYLYLTGDESLDRFLVVMGIETCHDTHISDPDALVELLDMPYFFKSSAAADPAEENTGERFHIYPNPVSSQLNIQFIAKTGGDVTICVYDSKGAVYYEKALTTHEGEGHRLTFDTSRLTPGIYFCKIKTTLTSKVVKMVKM